MVIRRRTGWTGQIAPRALLAVLSVLGLIASGCSSDDELQADEAATVDEGSQVKFAVDGETWSELGSGGVVPAGAQVKAAGDEARLIFRGGAVRLSSDAVATVTNERVTLERGEVLVASTAGLASVVDDTTIDGDATYRLDSGLASRVGVYEGEVSVQRPAQERTVPALRQLQLADVRLAARPAPLRYVHTDAWDRELLVDAIAFDAEAGNLSRGMTAEFGSDPLPPRFYQRFTGSAAVRVLASAAGVSQGRKFGPPSDVLLTFFVADAAGGSSVDTIRRVSGLRSAGARWGLIAVDLGVQADAVVAAIDRLDNRELALGDLAPDVRNPSQSTTGDASGSQGEGVDGAGVADTGSTGTDDTTTTGEGDTDTDGDGDVEGGGGEDPPPTGGEDPPGGGGGGDPDPPPPPPPSEEPSIGDVVTGVVQDATGDPGEDEQNGGGLLPEELDAVNDLIDLDN